MRAMSDEDSASPVCYLREAPDSYMGYLPPNEIQARLDALIPLLPDAAARRALNDLLPRIRDDAVHARVKALIER